MDKFVSTYQRLGIKSVAFPILGSQHGGLPEDQVLELMKASLEVCEIPVDIYRYDPSAKDEWIDELKLRFTGVATKELAALTGIQVNRIGAIQRALERNQVCSVGQLAGIRGIGEKTLAKAFAWMRQQPAQIEMIL